MESETQRALARQQHEDESWRRRCGCLRTSDKLKRMLDCFPPPPPPTPDYPKGINALASTCISAFCTNVHPCPKLQPPIPNKVVRLATESQEEPEPEKPLKRVISNNFLLLDNSTNRKPKQQWFTWFDIPWGLKARLGSWRVVRELVQLLQVSVTATALALYYLIYCYMQLVYYTLRSALYFHHADGAMKITIMVVTITSLVVAFNLILKIENLFGIK